jgi:hypothetical protein
VFELSVGFLGNTEFVTLVVAVGRDVNVAVDVDVDADGIAEVVVAVGDDVDADAPPCVCTACVVVGCKLVEDCSILELLVGFLGNTELATIVVVVGRSEIEGVDGEVVVAEVDPVSPDIRRGVVVD